MPGTMYKYKFAMRNAICSYEDEFSDDSLFGSYWRQLSVGAAD